MIAALFVETGGVYAGLPGVDSWGRERDARLYAGPWPAVAHPPCQRWGRYATGSPRKPAQYTIGADDGCFVHALSAIRRWGGVLEHPKDSLAWRAYGLLRPIGEGWHSAGDGIGWTCCVEQGHYGHFSRKPTWLYAAHCDLPSLRWGRSEQRLPAYALERYGYAKARRIGVMAAVGGKRKTEIRNATPVAFRDLLLDIARTALPQATTPKRESEAVSRGIVSTMS